MLTELELAAGLPLPGRLTEAELPHKMVEPRAALERSVLPASSEAGAW